MDDDDELRRALARDGHTEILTGDHGEVTCDTLHAEPHGLEGTARLIGRRYGPATGTSTIAAT